MGSVSRLDARRAGLTLGGAAAAFLDALEDTGTRRNYAGTLRALAGRFESGAPLATLEDPDVAMALAAWFTDRWGKAAAATFNRNLDALRSAVRFWMVQGWLADDPTSGLRRRRRAVDRTRALSRAEIDELLARGDVALREKTLWRLLYETAARANEVLSLDVGDLDVRNRKAKVRRKGGAVDVIVWRRRSPPPPAGAPPGFPGNAPPTRSTSGAAQTPGATPPSCSAPDADPPRPASSPRSAPPAPNPLHAPPPAPQALIAPPP